MKQKPIPEPKEKLQSKCDDESQFSNLDRLFRSVISVPKTDVLEAEIKEKRLRARKKKSV